MISDALIILFFYTGVCCAFTLVVGSEAVRMAARDTEPSLWPPEKKKKDRAMDFSKYPTVHIVLRLAYHGQDHDGLAKQENTSNTIEWHLAQALLKVRLVPNENPEKYSRCGRTDKGVSALGNAVSLVVRGAADGQPPLNYPAMLNRALPPTIRIVAWAPVPDTFDARFSCLSRSYRYYFVKGNLDVCAMRKGARMLLGTHDFRNFCKMDVVNVSNFVREVLDIDILEGPVGVSYLWIRGNAFLYHQIRCIMAVLFMVGKGLEPVEVVPELLDVAANPAKPCYALADDAPLVLWDCAFDPSVVRWEVDASTLQRTLQETAALANTFAIRTAIAADMGTDILQRFAPAAVARDGGSVAPEALLTTSHSATGAEQGEHVPLLKRPREHTYEQKVNALSDRKKSRRDANVTKKDGHVKAEDD
jgi:tRNA pseudouridine38/39 synthase